MPEISTKQVLIWETSAINNLGRRSDCDELIANMQTAYIHWIPAYIFDEIAATKSRDDRKSLLKVCEKLKGHSGRVLISPWFLIEAGVRIFSELGELDWNVLLQTQPEYEQAIASGLFDDDLASTQKEQNRQNSKMFGEFLVQQRQFFARLFQLGSDSPKALGEIINDSLFNDLIRQNVRYYC
jgi:hypothetical protein